MKTKYSFIGLVPLVATIVSAGFFANTSGQHGYQQIPDDSAVVDKIAFYSGRFGNHEICMANPDGTGFQRLTNNTTDDECPSFSPDGKKITFVSNRDGNFEIYLMNPDGSEQQRLTQTPENELHTDWSPDGTRIAFSRYPDQSHANIFVMNADGSNIQQLTTNAGENMRPDWSPDGTQILFNTNKDGNYEIYLMNADGSNQQRLSNTAAWEVFPQLSPDGSKIIYARLVMNPFYGEIHIRNLDGSGDVALTQNSRSENPIWSPDGKQLAFQSSRSGNFEVYTMNADGSNQQQLTTHSGWDGWPCWGRIQVSTGIRNRRGDLPEGFNLHQNYPNPFNPSTTIQYDLPNQTLVTLKLVDPLGREVTTLVNEKQKAGRYTLVFDAGDLPSNVYFYRLKTENFSKTKKMVLVK